MKKLTYFIDRGNGCYEPFYEYSVSSVGMDEMYARQLCTYFIMKGKQYELISNEMNGDEEILLIKDLGVSPVEPGEEFYRGKELSIEFRHYLKENNYQLLKVIHCTSHFEIIRYLLKDVVDIPEWGQMITTSTEIDEDRGVYVIYIKTLNDVEV